MTNGDLVRAFEELADLLEIQGADGFRVNTYRRVARTIDDFAGDVRELAAAGKLRSLKGVGESSAEKIQELLATGRLALREELAREVPVSLLELLRIQNVGPKKAGLLWKECGITNLADLKEALAKNKLIGVKGFGAKSIAGIAEGIAFLEQNAGRVRLGYAHGLAHTIADILRTVPGVARVELAGSLRRGRETVGDIDILCACAAAAPVVERFTTLPGVKQVLGAGETKASVLLEYRADRVIQTDLRIVGVAHFGAALQYFTGSKEHNVRLREMAVKRGWSLNEYGLKEGEAVLAAATEEEIYQALGLPWIPPELREDRDEFDLRATPALLTLAQIRGDLHMHTRASDGHNSIAEMATAAQRCGYDYCCITDHSRSSVVANGLTVERLREHILAVRAAAAQLPEFTLWIGAEVDILADGRLDYPDDVLAELDWVVASVHANASADAELNTRRTLSAIRNPYVNLIAHPTGRLLGRREAMPLDIDAIAREAAATGTALEINASEYRLDLKDQHARRAAELGATICIDTDSHGVDQLAQMRFGVITARRAGLTADRVLNTRSAAEVRAFVQEKRRRLR